MTTTEKLPEDLGGIYVKVDWELGDQFDYAGDGHVFMHFATGWSDQGHKFEATGIVCDGEFTDIDDVEFCGIKENEK